MSERTIQQLFDLTGQVALITGGTGYLGSTMARALAEAGATVVIGSREQQRASDAASALPGPGDHSGVTIDHMEPDLIEQGFSQVVQRHGKIDILINNGNEHCKNDWTTVEAEEFTRQLANATGYFLLARKLRDHLVARQATGSIVMLGSMYGSVGSYPDAYAGIVVASPVAYHALKGGIQHMTRHLAVYWAKDGVRVNCLSPGPFPSAKANAQMVERLCTKSPMGRMGTPDELKGAVVFLASDASSYVTGQNLLVDGGWTAW